MREFYLQNLTFVEWSIYQDAISDDQDIEFIEGAPSPKTGKGGNKTWH